MNQDLHDLLKTVSHYTDLGHAKRDEAFLRQIQKQCMHPCGTAAGGATNWADTISAFRFASNPDIAVEDLREARREAILDRVQPEETILLIHDVSLLDYSRHESKTDRKKIGDGKGQGYEYVCNLAVSLERELPLGVLHDSLISATGPDDIPSVDYFDTPLVDMLPAPSIKKLPGNHKHIVTAHARHITEKAKHIKWISVGDREFDDYFHFRTLQHEGIDGVIRSCATRNVQVKKPEWLPEAELTRKYAGLPLLPGHACTKLDRLVKYVPTTPLKTIFLDKNERLTCEGPEAEAVPVSVGSFQITLYRNAKRDRVYVPSDEYVKLNVVVIQETEPRKGRTPILWVLLTTLPIETPEHLATIVRIYELRWLIECFFKLLKSGFNLEHMHIQSAERLAKHLVVITIAAAFITALKHSVGLGAGTKLDEGAFQKVKHASKNLNDDSIDLNLRLFAFLALMGQWFGHKNQGISPLMLMKGIHKTLGVLAVMNSCPDFMAEIARTIQNAKYAYKR